MKNNTPLSVREIKKKDIELIANYWERADPKYLESLGVAPERRVTRDELQKALTKQLNSPIREKSSCTLIAEIDGRQIGHTNISRIKFGLQAFFHCHLWYSDIRQKGYGTEFALKSFHYYFDNFNLKQIICDPYARNTAPNKALENLGFEFIKQYTTIPGAQNFEQDVKEWRLSKNQYKKLISEDKINT